jgi:hypothetical protein
MDGAISQVQIDEVLVRHVECSSEPLKIDHRRLDDSNGLFESPQVRVPLPLYREEIILHSRRLLP